MDDEGLRFLGVIIAHYLKSLEKLSLELGRYILLQTLQTLDSKIDVVISLGTD